MILETALPGDPEDFHEAARALRGVLRQGATHLGDVVARQRTHLASGLQGRTGELFSLRAGGLVDAIDAFADVAWAAARRLDDLGDSLHRAQADLELARAEAIGAGLRVSGTRIHSPDLLSGDPDYARHQQTWMRVVGRCDDTRTTWRGMLDVAVQVAGDYAVSLVQLTESLLAGAYTGALLDRMATVMRAEAQQLQAQAGRTASRIAELTEQLRSGALPPGYDDLDRLTRELDEFHAGRAVALEAAESRTVPLAVRGGVTSLGLLTTGLGIVVDIHEGESVEQAVVSQGGAFAAGLAAGAVAGSIVPCPGTVAGAIVVGLVAGAVGWGTDTVIDKAYEGGDDEHEDPADAESGLVGAVLAQHQQEQQRGGR
ncbi:hypothetical protein BH11ACT8_BH11ACT8_20290 [soil metagenome]